MYYLKTFTLLSLVLALSFGCKKKETTTNEPIIEYSNNLGVLPANQPTYPNIFGEILTGYQLNIHYFFDDYEMIQDDISSITLEYDDIYSIEHSSLGFDDLYFNILCDHNTFQTNEHTFLVRIETYESGIYELTITFKLLQDEAFNLAKALINNSRNNTLKLTGDQGDSWTGVELADFEADTEYGMYRLTFKFKANQKNGLLANSYYNNTSEAIDDHIYLSIINTSFGYGSAISIWYKFEHNGDITKSGKTLTDFTVNGNTVNGTWNNYPFSFTLN